MLRHKVWQGFFIEVVDSLYVLKPNFYDTGQ